jgi:hypothetical protein
MTNAIAKEGEVGLEGRLERKRARSHLAVVGFDEDVFHVWGYLPAYKGKRIAMFLRG